jgi:hypothetical protein
VEREIKEAIGLGNPQLQPEPKPAPTPAPQVTIYDFADLLGKNEPPKK